MKFTNNCTPEYLLLAAIFGVHALTQTISQKIQPASPKPVVRMRGIRDAIVILKQADSDTAITYGIVRKLIDSKKLSSIQAGRKILINLDELLAYFNMEAR